MRKTYHHTELPLQATVTNRGNEVADSLAFYKDPFYHVAV